MAEGERKEPGSRKKKPAQKPAPAAWIAAAAAAAIAIAGVGAGTAGYLYYVKEGEQYRTVFFPNTFVNGIDVSLKTAGEAEMLVVSAADEYILTVAGRGGVEEKITGTEIGMHHVSDGTFERYLDSQNPMEWWGHRNTATGYRVDNLFEADEAMLRERIEKLVFLDDAQMKEPKDARLSDYIAGEGYRIIPEEEGTALDKAKVRAAVTEAVHNLQSYLSLEELGVYQEVKVTSDDPGLREAAEKLNAYLNVTITYQFGDRKEILDKDTIFRWIALDNDGTVTLDQERVAAYVKGLADQYDTAGKDKTLVTTAGDTVTVPGATYGWRIDQAKETEELCTLLAAGESQTREPVYSQTANSHGENDYGDTYVELNLTDQHLYFYKDGELVIETDFVSGTHSKNQDTPLGAYFINYKQRDRVLRGERQANGSYQYASHVDYWMPFIRGVGLHDASWRGSFGGEIYLRDGSHGCVNLPPPAAKTIYESISAGDAVLSFTTDGTGTTAYPGAS